MSWTSQSHGDGEWPMWSSTSGTEALRRAPRAQNSPRLGEPPASPGPGISPHGGGLQGRLWEQRHPLLTKCLPEARGGARYFLVP